MTLFYDKPTNKRGFQPFLSYQVLKYIGLVLIGISQFVVIRSMYSYMPSSVDPNAQNFIIPENLANFLKTFSAIGTPLVMISLFANFMYNRQNIKFFMLLYFVMMICFAFGEKIGMTLLVKYICSQLGIVVSTGDELWLASIKLLQTLLVYNGGINMFIDFFLFACFFFFMFYTPKKHEKLFRWGILLPLIYLLGTNSFFIALNFRPDLYEIWDTYVLAEVLNLFPSKNLSTYIIYFAILFYVSKKDKSLDFTGVSSKDFTKFLSLVLVMLSIIELFLSYVPKIENFNLGNTYSLFLCVPFVLLFDYKCEIKHRWITYTQPLYYCALYGTFFYYFSKMFVFILELLKVFIPQQASTGLLIG